MDKVIRHGNRSTYTNHGCRCRLCTTAASADKKRFRHANPGSDNVSRANYTRKNKKLIADYLSTHPCVDCGERDIVVLEFDHVRGIKLHHVSAMWNSYSPETIIKEIEKCEIRCANCHRRITAKRRSEKADHGTRTVR